MRYVVTTGGGDVEDFASKEVYSVLESRLYTAVVSDVLDSLGYRNQVMRADLNPLIAGSVVAGRARTLLAVDYYELLEQPYETEMRFIEALNPGDIVVAGTNQSVENGLWGELLTTAAKIRGARGAIIDGVIRDVRKIKGMDFPLWCTGSKPVDSAGRGMTLGYDYSIKCGGVLVHSGDVVFGDEDGIVVIPEQLVAQVVRLALEKVTAEDATRQSLRDGMSLLEVYKKFGVL